MPWTKKIQIAAIIAVLNCRVIKKKKWKFVWSAGATDCSTGAGRSITSTIHECHQLNCSFKTSSPVSAIARARFTVNDMSCPCTGDRV